MLFGGDWNMTFISPYIGNVVIPIDFHIFQRGWNHQPAIEIVDFPSKQSYFP